MNRRGFLVGCLAAGVAPAIVSNPMKLFIPKDIILSTELSGDDSPWVVWEIVDTENFYSHPLMSFHRESAHPDAYGIGFGNGHKFESDEYFLRQLKAYAKCRGVEATKQVSYPA